MIVYKQPPKQYSSVYNIYKNRIIQAIEYSRKAHTRGSHIQLLSNALVVTRHMLNKDDLLFDPLDRLTLSVKVKETLKDILYNTIYKRCVGHFAYFKLRKEKMYILEYVVTILFTEFKKEIIYGQA